MSSFTKIRSIVFAGVMTAALTGTALAGGGDVQRTDGATSHAALAQAKADSARAHAKSLAWQGGWAYKTGAVERATRDAARFQAEADALRQPVAPTSEPSVAPVSPELAAARARVQELRQAGGWAYKTGAIERADADVRAISGPQPVSMGLNETAQPYRNWGKPVEQSRRAYR